VITAKTNIAVVEHPAAFTAVWATSAPATSAPATSGLATSAAGAPTTSALNAAVSTKAVYRDRVPGIGMTDVVFGQAHRPRRKPF
jgi:hypothetical protein